MQSIHDYFNNIGWDKLQILKDLKKAGNIYVLYGVGNSGKTTFLRLIQHLYPCYIENKYGLNDKNKDEPDHDIKDMIYIYELEEEKDIYTVLARMLIKQDFSNLILTISKDITDDIPEDTKKGIKYYHFGEIKNKDNTLVQSIYNRHLDTLRNMIENRK